MESSDHLVVLLGTFHRYQLPVNNKQSSDYNDFYDAIHKLVKVHQVKAIAEEMNVDAIEERELDFSIASKFCSDNGLIHQYSDPTRIERKEIGVLQDNDVEVKGFLESWTPEQIVKEKYQSNRMRENFWLSRIKELNIWPVLFICGADHFEPFSKLLEKEGFNVMRTCAEWEPTNSNN